MTATTVVPVGIPPTMKRILSGKLYVVIGDPRGPLAHPWCSSEVRKVYRIQRHALAKLAALGEAYRRRVAYHQPARAEK